MTWFHCCAGSLWKLWKSCTQLHYELRLQYQAVKCQLILVKPSRLFDANFIYFDVSWSLYLQHHPRPRGRKKTYLIFNTEYWLEVFLVVCRIIWAKCLLTMQPWCLTLLEPQLLSSPELVSWLLYWATIGLLALFLLLQMSEFLLSLSPKTVMQRGYCLHGRLWYGIAYWTSSCCRHIFCLY